MYEGMFTDKQRMQLAREEFNDMNYMVNRDVTIGEGNSKTCVGTVDSFVRGRTGVNGDRDSGLDALVVKDERTKTVRILFQGSKDSNDWGKNNLPLLGELAKGMASKNAPKDTSQIPPQLKESASFVKQVINNKEYAGYGIELYGQSLGSIDGQYALASLNKEQSARIKGAWLYEGPNIYWVLPDSMRSRARSYGSRVSNYVDDKDPIAQGYGVLGEHVGKVYHIQSKWAMPGVNPAMPPGDGNNTDNNHFINQHMWGGYQFTEDGSIVLGKSWISNAKDQTMKYLKDTVIPRMLTDSNFSLSPSQNIFLDAEQAVAVTQAVEERMDLLEFDMEALHKKTIAKAKKGWDDIVKSLNETIGMGMSQEELEQALASTGFTRQKFIEMIEAEIKPIEDSVMDIHKGIEETGQQTREGIQKMVDADVDLARTFDDYGGSFSQHP